MQKFDDKILGKQNETYQRYKFNNGVQQEDETIDQYLTALYNLAKTCNFCDCLNDSLIRNRLVIGIQDNQTRK